MKKRTRKSRAAETTPDPEKRKSDLGRSNWIRALLLAAIIVVAYSPVWVCGFVNLDDNLYVTDNPAVARGLTWHGVAWAFTSTYAANWHPLTWLSHMLDVQMYGLNAGPHHLTSVLLHIANTLLLFWFLYETTRAPGASTLVAALFAVHPLHVESVAWIAERKDVLSTLFWLLTLIAYVFYTRGPTRSRYLAVAGFFIAGLMAKPMLVTLPLVLLLLDFWPLRRWTLHGVPQLPSLFREKLPLIGLSAISAVVTLVAQKNGGALLGMDRLPVAGRIANAFVAYFVYIERMLWPARLAVFYPLTPPSSYWWLAALGVLGTSVFAIGVAERRPYITTGWFWFLGTLVPVIGFIQVGGQATADRYTYVPLIGLFLIVAFGAADVLEWFRTPGYVFAVASAVILAACVLLTREQLKYWVSSKTLWEHALAVTNRNVVAHIEFGRALQQEGNLNDAINQYSEALQIAPASRDAHGDLGSALEGRGELDAAIFQYSEALRIGPADSDLHYDLGNALAKSGKTQMLDQAVSHLTEAVRLNPDFANPHNSLGFCYSMQEKWDSAIKEFSEAVRLKPTDASMHNNLATVLGSQGRFEEAVSESNEALRLDPNYGSAHDNLGMLFAKAGRKNEAVAQFSAALRINPDDRIAKAWLVNLR